VSKPFNIGSNAGRTTSTREHQPDRGQAQEQKGTLSVSGAGLQCLPAADPVDERLLFQGDHERHQGCMMNSYTIMKWLVCEERQGDGGGGPAD
jgi:hypothetical protein